MHLFVITNLCLDSGRRRRRRQRQLPLETELCVGSPFVVCPYSPNSNRILTAEIGSALHLSQTDTRKSEATPPHRSAGELRITCQRRISIIRWRR